jgi:hypothetical protein
MGCSARTLNAGIPLLSSAGFESSGCGSSGSAGVLAFTVTAPIEEPGAFAVPFKLSLNNF